MSVPTTLQDILAAVDAASKSPESQVADSSGFQLSDLTGRIRSSIQGLDFRTALAFLNAASEAELSHGFNSSWGVALSRLRDFIAESVTLRPCPECGAEVDRACTINRFYATAGANGRSIQVPWIHAARSGSLTEVSA